MSESNRCEDFDLTHDPNQGGQSFILLFTIELAFVLTFSSFGFGLSWNTNNVKASTLNDPNISENMECVENTNSSSDLETTPVVNDNSDTHILVWR